MIKIAKWKYNTCSPVMFMIDDIANIYMKKNKTNELKIGEDWGHYGFQKNSMWDFLTKELFSKFPHIKTTFFLVVGKRSPMILNQEYSYSENIDKDENFISFIKELSLNPNIEFAYHGTNHGKEGIDLYDFKQEWETYTDINDAVTTINKGKELFKSILGFYPKGGKYCGYKKGNFGDESISKTNFEWWCRDWDASLDVLADNTLSYECEYFDNVIDIPSTVDGSLYSLKNVKFNKKYLSSIRYFIKYKINIERKITKLYENNQIISIQEHSSPFRTDDRIQYPNIVSDMDNLIYIFTLLNKMDVWYATGSEISDYFRAYTKANITNTNDELNFVFTDKLVENTEITLIVDNDIKLIFIENNRLEYKTYLKNDLNLVDLPILSNKKYKLVR